MKDTYYINDISLLNFEKKVERINPSSFGGEKHEFPISIKELPNKVWEIVVTHRYTRFQDNIEGIILTTGTRFNFAPEIFDKTDISEDAIVFMTDQVVFHSRAILAVECKKVSNKFVLMNPPDRQTQLMALKQVLAQLKPNQGNKAGSENLN